MKRTRAALFRWENGLKPSAGPDLATEARARLEGFQQLGLKLMISTSLAEAMKPNTDAAAVELLLKKLIKT
jgi:hypothetical protein